MGGVEQLIGNVHRESLLPKVPHILKQFYDQDILDEEVILDWAKKVTWDILLVTLDTLLSPRL